MRAFGLILLGSAIGASFAGAALLACCSSSKAPVSLGVERAPQISQDDFGKVSTREAYERFADLSFVYPDELWRDHRFENRGAGLAQFTFLFKPRPVGGDICAIRSDHLDLTRKITPTLKWVYTGRVAPGPTLYASLADDQAQDISAAPKLYERCSNLEDADHLFTATDAATAVRASSLLRTAIAGRNASAFSAQCGETEMGVASSKLKRCDAAKALGELDVHDLTQVDAMASGSGFVDILWFSRKAKYPKRVTIVKLASEIVPEQGKTRLALRSVEIQKTWAY